MTNNLKRCKFDISAESPHWHIRYNDIIDSYTKVLEEGEKTSISGLSEDDCIILAMSLAKLSPDKNVLPSWDAIEDRLSQATVVTIPDQEEITFRVILPFSHMSYREAELFLSVKPYVWADVEHLSYRILVVKQSAIEKEYDVPLYEHKAKSLFRERCLKAFHEMGERYDDEQHSLNRLMKKIVKWRDAIRRRVATRWY